MKEYLTHPVFSIVESIGETDQTEVYVIGGFVRDLLLGRPSKDIDIMVIGNGIDLAKKVANRLSNEVVVTIFRRFGTAMFRYEGIEFEFVGARKESYSRDSRKPAVETGTLQDDQNRRDLTINALAISLNKKNYGELIDPFDGIEDLKSGIIRTPLDPVITFSDDPLRMLRAIRFAVQLHFEIHPKTLQAIKESKGRIGIVSFERIADELHKMILSDKPSRAFKLMDKTGLLGILLPEIEALKGVETINGFSHKDKFNHTLQVLDNISQLSKHLWLRWAAVFHDIAKPRTKKISEHGWTFHGHEYVGAKMIPDLFKRLRFPLNEKMEYVQRLVLLHLRPIALVDGEVSDSAVRRLIFDAGDCIEDLMQLAEADITSKNDKRVEQYLANLKQVRERINDVELRDRIRNWKSPISGDLIMNTFHMGPSKDVGRIKEAIKDAILDGIIENNYESAYAFMVKTALEIGYEVQV
jgi:poly(A) polymerase